jgi:hypothetical protein
MVEQGLAGELAVGKPKARTSFPVKAEVGAERGGGCEVGRA